MKKIIASLIVLLFTTANWAQSTDRTIDLIVEAKKNIMPDLLVVSVDLKYKAKKEQEALNLLNEKMDKQISSIEKVGFKKEQIKLSEFRIEEIENEDSRKVKTVGFEAIQTLSIKIPLSDKGLISKMIEEFGFDKKDNIEINVSSELSDELEQKVRNQVIAKALNDATEKAELMAKTMHINLGKVKSIEYGELYFRPILRNTIRFTPPRIVRDEEQTKVKASYDVLGLSETEIRDKVHVVWFVE